MGDRSRATSRRRAGPPGADRQWRLPLGPDDLATRVGERLGRPVRVTPTENTACFIRYRHARDGGVDLRVHRIFLSAPDTTLADIAAFVASADRRALGRLRAIFARYADGLSLPVEREALRTRGQHFDLQAIFDRLNARFFDGTIRADITWGRTPGRRVARRLQLGCYSHPHRLIRINPRLDHPRLPLYVMEDLIHHEMLHQLFAGRGGPVHSREFRAAEARYPRHREACAWIRRHFRLIARPVGDLRFQICDLRLKDESESESSSRRSRIGDPGPGRIPSPGFKSQIVNRKS